MFGRTEYKLRSKEEFYSKIKNYFLDLSGDLIPTIITTELSKYVTNLVFEIYQRRWKKFPKSRKRYSELVVEDLQSPYFQHRIFDFLKETTGHKHTVYTRQILGLSKSEFIEFEKRKNQYENM